MSHKLCELDLSWLKWKIKTLKDSLNADIQEDLARRTSPPDIGKKSSKQPNLNNDDKVRFIAAMLSEDALPLMFATQEVMTREQLDAHNSAVAIQDYFSKVAYVFNNKDFVDLTQYYSHLCPQCLESHQLESGSLTIDASKAKEVCCGMKNKHHGIICKWEQSGNGDGQRADDDEEWGHFDLQKVDTTNGADRRSFLDDPDQRHLLCLRASLDDLNLVQFTLAKLPNFMTANASHFVLFHSRRNPPGKKAGSSSPNQSKKLALPSSCLLNQQKQALAPDPEPD